MSTRAIPFSKLFQNEEPPKVLTAEEAASLLGVSKSTIYTLVRTKEIKAFRIGRSLRISTQDLFRYLDIGLA